MIPQIEGAFWLYGTPLSREMCKFKTQAVDAIVARLAEREQRDLQKSKKTKPRIKNEQIRT